MSEKILLDTDIGSDIDDALCLAYLLAQPRCQLLGITTTITFHDPLAATTLFDEQICGFTSGRVDIELSGERVSGLTHWGPGAQPAPHEVALRVDPERFFFHYFSVFG